MSKASLKRVKSLFKGDEAKALQSVVDISGYTAEQLEAAHSEKEFIWKVKGGAAATESGNQESAFPIFEYSKKDYTEEEAMAIAQDDLVTFGGNLRPLHDGENYRFTKVRG